MKIRKNTSEDKIELQMTPMIDIVFQLLVFFIMTFKIVLPEGDFNIRMPLPATDSQPQDPPDTPTLNLRMTAKDDGTLNSMTIGDIPIQSFADLRSYIVNTVGDAAGPGTASDQEVELQCDYDLHYENAIQAITAISGYIKDGQRFKLVEQIRFSPPVQ